MARVCMHAPVYLCSCIYYKCINKGYGLLLQEVVPTVLLKEHLEVDTLEAVGLIPSAKVFNQKFVKMKTRLL